MRAIRKRLFAVSFGLMVGCLLCAGLWLGYRASKPRPRRVTTAEQHLVRARLDDDPKAIYMFDESVSYRLKPNFRGVRYFSSDLPHTTNSLGLLGTDEVNDDPDVRKLLFLGDSVTYGNGVPFEQSFVAQMQQAAGSDLQLLNAACPGWGTLQELRFYQTHLAHLQPDLLVVMFCLNDLARYEWVYDSDREPRLSGEVPQWGEGTAQAARLVLKRRGYESDPKLAPLAKHHNGFLLAWDGAAWDEFWPHVVQPYIEQADLRGRIVFVALPTRDQLEAYRMGGPRDEIFFPQAQLVRYCSQSGVACIDTTELLLSTGATEEALFMDDCHLTRTGHARVASVLWPQLYSLIDRGRLATKPGATASPTRR